MTGVNINININIKITIASGLAVLLLAGCAGTHSPPSTAPFVHAVFFKVKPGSSDSAAEIVKDVNEMLAPLPTVKGLWVGKRAAGTEVRPVVDTNFDVGLLVLFEDMKGLQDYLDHPTHVKFAQKHDTLCDVRVFDFVR